MRLDRRLDGSLKFGWRYTRYADDITFLQQMLRRVVLKH